MVDRETLRAALERRGRELGFALIGVASADSSDHMAFYRSWIASGFHGEMGYLAQEDGVARREDLSATMDGVQSCIVVAHEYGAHPESVAEGDPARAVVARYARGTDYHLVLTSRLEELLAWLDTEVEGGVRGRVYVDTGPILERDLARRAGLGWFGRNTMLIHPRKGSYFFLGVLLVDLDLPPDAPFQEDHCGTCRACLDACPTGALLGRDVDGAPVIDARLCISYLTIELRGPIPRELRAAVGNRVFGCDICQEVCPFTIRFAPTTDPSLEYADRPDLDGPPLLELTTRILSMSGKAYLRDFGESPLSRARRRGMLRNLCVALGNWGDASAAPVLGAALSEASPLVRSHAAWALGEIGTDYAAELVRARVEVEWDPGVIEELEDALSRIGSGTR